MRVVRRIEGNPGNDTGNIILYFSENCAEAESHYRPMLLTRMRVSTLFPLLQLQGCQDNDDLNVCPQPRPVGCSQPGGHALRGRFLC